MRPYESATRYAQASPRRGRPPLGVSEAVEALRKLYNACRRYNARHSSEVMRQSAIEHMPSHAHAMRALQVVKRCTAPSLHLSCTYSTCKLAGKGFCYRSADKAASVL